MKALNSTKHGGATRRTFAYSLERADLSAVLHHVDGEVDLGQRLLLLNRANGIVDLGGSSRDLLSNVGVAFGIHGGDWRVGVLDKRLQAKKI